MCERGGLMLYGANLPDIFRRTANVRADGQEPDMRRERWASGQLNAKPISIKGARRKFGGCARKAVELTSGDLSCVTES